MTSRHAKNCPMRNIACRCWNSENAPNVLNPIMLVMVRIKLGMMETNQIKNYFAMGAARKNASNMERNGGSLSADFAVTLLIMSAETEKLNNAKVVISNRIMGRIY